MTRAAKLSQGPILLIDHSDNCASGGTQDTMAVVAEVMRAGYVWKGRVLRPAMVRTRG